MFRHVCYACILALAFALAAVAQPDTAAGKPPPVKPAPPPPVTLEGTVKGLAGMGPAELTKMVTCTLVTAAGEQKLHLAPQAYLTEIGLVLKDGATVTVTIIGLQKADKPVAVRTITLDGKTFKVRDAAGRSLWGQFVGLPEVTRTGVIKKVITPAPAPMPEANAKPIPPERMPVSFQLETDAGLFMVAVGQQAILDTLGFTLTEGAKVTVAGWQRDLPAPKKGADAAALAARPKATLHPRTLTFGEKTYTLRDAKGKECWKPKPEPKHKPVETK